MGVKGNSAALTYAVRPRVVVKYLGQLSLILAGLTLPPLAVSLWFKEYDVTWGFAVALMLLLGVWLVGVRLPEAERIQSNEGLVVTALGFSLGSLLMSYPMMQGGLEIEDAFFESVSAITTTGLSTLDSVESLPHTLLFSRAWMQWYGGLGIVVLSAALLLGHGIISRRLTESETPLDNLLATTRTHARRILSAYAALTVIGILSVWALGVDLFPSVAHVLSAVSTGGFSIFDRSLAGLEWWVPRGLLMVLAFCGALALPLYSYLGREGPAKFIGDTEAKGLLVGALMTSTLLGLFLERASAEPLLDRLGHALFIGFSAQTGTGFTTLPIDALEPAGMAALLGSMIVGGSVGSTSGGIKVWRFLIMLGLIRHMLYRTTLPRHAMTELRIGGRLVEEGERDRALMLGALFLLVIFGSWLPFVALGHDPLPALFEVVSATATVGLSAGIAAPDLSPPLKLILCADMLLGRLEIIAFLVLLYPKTWLGPRTEMA